MLLGVPPGNVVPRTPPFGQLKGKGAENLRVYLYRLLILISIINHASCHLMHPIFSPGNVVPRSVGFLIHLFSHSHNQAIITQSIFILTTSQMRDIHPNIQDIQDIQDILK
jgi:hypothetical protein